MTSALKVEAYLTNTGTVLDYVEAVISKHIQSELLLADILLVVEEIFVNIAHYAYEPDAEKFVDMSISIHEDVVIRFEDSGKPFDPTTKEAPNLDVPIAEREIGGLGWHLVKEFTDKIAYEYVNGKNILTITKKLDKVNQLCNV